MSIATINRIVISNMFVSQYMQK